MEINYNLIIKYLVTKKTTFASKKHILLSSDLFPNKFKDLFQNKFYRYGINQTNGFYNSLLTLLNKDFIMYNNDEEICEVKQITNNVHDVNVNINIINENHIKYLTNLLQINILIFDFKNEEIKLVHCEDECNPYKPTILIVNYDEFYEPVMCETDNKKIFSYNDPIIKKIYQLQNIKLNEDLNKLLNEFLPKKIDQDLLLPDLQSTNKEKLDDNQTFIKVNENKKYTEAELNKIKKEDLEKILDEKNIKIVGKKLKKEIIKIILEH